VWKVKRAEFQVAEPQDERENRLSFLFVARGEEKGPEKMSERPSVAMNELIDDLPTGHYGGNSPNCEN
jgi:hypothetical protein